MGYAGTGAMCAEYYTAGAGDSPLRSGCTDTSVFKRKRYCRSEEQKCELVNAQDISEKPPSMDIAAKERDSPMVEHAPYSPKYGTPESFMAKDEPIHWSSRSPEKM